MEWSEVRAWRKTRRAELIGYRANLSRETRDSVRDRIVARLREIPNLASETIGFYMPFKGEVDLRGFLRELLASGAKAALPAVVQKAHPVEFRAWYPGVRMERGIWDIPIPAPGNPVLPTLLFVPLVGFDEAGYRLGHGGGYYDRTLAARSPRPRAIGVGYESTRLPTIHPQPHDIPMDAIATEAGMTWFERGAR
ncbi:MAG: 5-formyltetrahydrofolate cyclo-ligase [Alphaproteobacteria bacterium]|nr:5-formyltetrahydrofolate cyclo-ligase [Alphaproteobacteria bacterium]